MYEIPRIGPKLFIGWVDETKKLQEGHFLEKYYGSATFEQMSEREKISYIKENFIAAIAELVEMLDECSWKPWASAEFLNRASMIGEIVDVLHFLGNILAALGVDDRELEAEYMEKVERNKKRHLIGYTGLEKCSGCRRAVDDIRAHDGEVYETSENDLICDSCLQETEEL